MKKNLISPFISSLLLLGLAAALNSGCGKREASPAGSRPAKSETKTTGIVSAEKNSFNEVTAQLDPGGSFYLYLGTEQWLDGLSGKVSGWRKLFESMPDVTDDNRANINKAFDVGARLIKESGLEDVSGVGVSSIALEPGLYHTKALAHHYPEKGSGFLWKMFGAQPHALTGLDLLPANTAMAMFSDLDVPLAWSVIAKQAGQSGIPEARTWAEKLPATFEEKTGIKWSRLLDSLGGEFGFVVTFNEANPVKIPVPGGEQLEIPEPGLLIVAKVKDDTIFNRVDETLQQGMPVEKADKSGLKMRTMNFPLPLPIQLRPSIATGGGYLFIASSDALIEEALAVKDGKNPGLKSNDEFKQLSQQVPLTGNQFTFVSRRFGEALLQIQKQALSRTASSQQQWLQSFLKPGQAGHSFAVGSSSDDGMLTIGNGSQHPGAVLAIAPAFVVGMLSAIAIPNFVRARDTAQHNACINNLRQIDAAKQQWALENKKADTDIPTSDDIKLYLKNEVFPRCPQGGVYSINAINQDPTCSIPGHMPPTP